MNVIQLVFRASSVTGPYAPELLGLISGVGAIAARDYHQGVTEILQSSAIVFGSMSVIGLRRGVDKVHSVVSRPNARRT
jgi:hypothetical protein